jgi:hypothetical protein
VKKDRILATRLKDNPISFDASAKRRRSDRLKVLTTKVYLIRDRKDINNIESIYAEDLSIPKTHVKAIKSAFSIQWAKAEKSENEGVKKKDTFEIVDKINVPPGCKIIPDKWIHAIKLDSTGRVVRFKARLTARGDLEDAEELDFQDAFSTVVGWQGLRSFLALTTLLDLKPLQIDVDLGYLYANLEEPVYMRPPNGAGCPPRKVWKLRKSLYSLLQSGKNWHTLITSIFMSDKFELHQMLTDSCLSVRRKEDGKIILLCQYDDDIIVLHRQ